MNLNLRIRFAARHARAASVAVVALALTGCNGEEVTVQRVPKPADPPAALASDPHAGHDHSSHAGHDHAAHAGHDHSAHAAMPPGGGSPHGDFHGQAGMARPQVKYTLPEGWTEKPASAMRAASFAVKGKDGQEADVSVIPLPPTGREVDLINLWRGNMLLEPLSDEQAARAGEAVTIGSEQGKLFDIASEKPVIGDKRARILVAYLTRGQTTWFFKATGEDSLVSGMRPAFLQFLKTVSFPEVQAAAADPHQGMADPHQGLNLPKPAADKPAASSPGVPEGWQAVDPGGFLTAKYVIRGTGDAKADVNVSVNAPRADQALANINRWRAQVGLAQITEADLATQTSVLDVQGVRSMLVDMAGTDFSGKKVRTIGVIVPGARETRFYKLMGDQQLVEQQKEAFTAFVQSGK